MSDVLLFAIAGGAGGLVWVGVTTAATWWFNRRQRSDAS